MAGKCPCLDQGWKKQERKNGNTGIFVWNLVQIMKKGQIYEGTVIEVDFPDKATVLTKETDKDGNENEYKVMVKGALQGQKVRYILQKARAGKCKGRLLEVLENSPEETQKPLCIHFGTCGGCTYQTLPYQTQLELKKNQVLKLLGTVLEEGSYIFDGIFPSPCEWGYRNKMEFSFGDEYKGGPLSLGLHKKGSIHDIINASGCKIVNNDYTKVLDCIRRHFASRNIPHYNKNTHTGILRHLLVRRAASTGEMLIALVTASGMEESLGLGQLGKELGNLELEGTITGFLHIINDGLGDVVKSDETRIIYGKDWITEEILGLKFRISVFSFFQTNTKGSEVLYNCVRNYITGKPAGVVFDLYSGTGTIAQIIAPVAGKVTGVEIVEEAVMAAKQNAADNGLFNCNFIAGDVLKVLDEIKEKPDFIILDPPREGINPKALKKIGGDIKAPGMVYISCKPTSLARDLAEFKKYGYKVERVCCVDMFPQNGNVETICKLTHIK